MKFTIRCRACGLSHVVHDATSPWRCKADETHPVHVKEG